jgi:elongation factor P
MKHNGNVLSIILPATISYTIESTVDGIKWDRSKAWTKPATLSNGMEVQVPLHKDAGDTVTLNTQTGKIS